MAAVVSSSVDDTIWWSDPTSRCVMLLDPSDGGGEEAGETFALSPPLIVLNDVVVFPG